MIEKVCVGNPRVALQVGAQLPVTPPVSPTPSPFGSTSHQPSLPSPSNISRSWLRTPSPEFRWAANARPMPILAPRVPANPVQNQGEYKQSVVSSENRECYTQPFVAVPTAPVFGSMAKVLNHRSRSVSKHYQSILSGYSYFSSRPLSASWIDWFHCTVSIDPKTKSWKKSLCSTLSYARLLKQFL